MREHGDAEEDIFGGAGKVPDEFKALVEGDASSELLQEASPLNDHRRFFSYDVELLAGNAPIGLLSKRLGPGSGGEHRTQARSNAFVEVGDARFEPHQVSTRRRTAGESRPVMTTCCVPGRPASVATTSSVSIQPHFNG